MKIITSDAFKKGLSGAIEVSAKHQENLRALRRSTFYLVVGTLCYASQEAQLFSLGFLPSLGFTLLTWGLLLLGAWGSFWGSFATLFSWWDEGSKRREAARYAAVQGNPPRVHAALASLPRRDMLGRYCPLTPVGRSEALLESALMRAGFAIAREIQPERGAIIPQYELLELGWGDWARKPQGPKNYVADFAYINPGLNLRVDIEIDEKDKGARGERRDQVFLERGWLVVRVTEAEVSLDSNGVARALRDMVSTLERGDPAAMENLLAHAA